jgi:hypothetical protein
MLAILLLRPKGITGGQEFLFDRAKAMKLDCDDGGVRVPLLDS